LTLCYESPRLVRVSDSLRRVDGRDDVCSLVGHLLSCSLAQLSHLTKDEPVCSVEFLLLRKRYKGHFMYHSFVDLIHYHCNVIDDVE